MAKARNYGIDLSKESVDQQGDEWKFGALSPKCLFAVPEEKRTEYLPDGEFQNIGEEKFGCVSRGYLNILETKFNYAYKSGLLLPDNKRWLEDTGYIENGKVTFSDAFIEILSGTTRLGNSMKAPAQTIHERGLIPKKLLVQLNSFESHYNPERITDELKRIGNEFLSRFEINYEQVLMQDFETLLRVDSVGIAAHAWPLPVGGEYPKTELTINHFIMAVHSPLTYIFDNYLDSDNDFIKKLARDYLFHPYGYRIYISKQNNLLETLPTNKETMEKENKPALLAWFIKTFLWLFDPTTPLPVKPSVKPTKPTTPTKESKIDKWALAIERFESGGNTNAANYRRNNPGNIKNTSGKFIVYATYEAGYSALCNYLIRACTDKHQAYTAKAKKLGLKSSGDLSILEFIQVYTGGDSPTIQKNYAEFIAVELGVPVNTPIKTFL